MKTLYFYQPIRLNQTFKWLPLMINSLELLIKYVKAIQILKYSNVLTLPGDIFHIFDELLHICILFTSVK